MGSSTQLPWLPALIGRQSGRVAHYRAAPALTLSSRLRIPVASAIQAHGAYVRTHPIHPRSRPTELRSVFGAISSAQYATTRRVEVAEIAPL